MQIPLGYTDHLLLLVWRPASLVPAVSTTAGVSWTSAVLFGDFGVSFTATVAGRYTKRGGPRLSVRGGPLMFFCSSQLKREE